MTHTPLTPLVDNSETIAELKLDISELATAVQRNQQHHKSLRKELATISNEKQIITNFMQQQTYKDYIKLAPYQDLSDELALVQKQHEELKTEKKRLSFEIAQINFEYWCQTNEIDSAKTQDPDQKHRRRAIEGNVVNVESKFGFLIIDKGIDNALQAGVRITVSRLREFICEADVIRVYRRYSVAEIRPGQETKTPVSGDHFSVQQP